MTIESNPDAAINHNNTPPPARTPPKESLVDRGIALAKALATAKDVPTHAVLDTGVAINEPSGFHFPATAQRFAAWRSGHDPDLYVPTPEEQAEAAEIFGAMDSRQHLGRSDRLTLVELIERQVTFYQSWQSGAGNLIADTLADLAAAVRHTEAATVEEYYDRVETLELDARQDRDARMFDAGFDAGCRHALPHNRPLD